YPCTLSRCLDCTRAAYPANHLDGSFTVRCRSGLYQQASDDHGGTADATAAVDEDLVPAVQQGADTLRNGGPLRFGRRLGCGLIHDRQVDGLHEAGTDLLAQMRNLEIAELGLFHQGDHRNGAERFHDIEVRIEIAVVDT